MANNVFQVKRTSVSGRTPNTTNSGNTQYINAGELALNMTDQIVYTSDGNTLITVGSNTVNQRVTGNLTVNAIIANGSLGNPGYVLTTNGSTVHWASAGDVSSTNTDAQYTWTNTQTFTNTITFNGNVVVNTNLTVNTIIANGSVGSNGNILISNGTSVYWGNGGFSNGQSISVNNFVITGSFTANGTTGATNQILASNGSAVYWSNNFIVTYFDYGSIIDAPINILAPIDYGGLV